MGRPQGCSWAHLWLSLPSRITPGAGLVERIQAIAQNVSDIAVKVDQILRHSLILHSKGASGQDTALCPPRLMPCWIGQSLQEVPFLW